MRYLTLFFLILGINWSFSQQYPKVDFSQLNRADMKTPILVTHIRPFSPLVVNEKKSFSMYTFLQAYKELSTSSPSYFSSMKKVRKKAIHKRINTSIPIGIIHTNYELVSYEAYKKGWVSFEDGVMRKDKGGNIFKKYAQTIVAPLSLHKIGLATTFEVQEELFVNTTDNKITTIKIDFDDGRGTLSIVKGQKIKVNYSSPGKKELIFTISFEDGSEVTRYSYLQVNYSNDDLTQQFGLSIDSITSSYTPDLLVYGETDVAPGQCEYEIFLSKDSILDKPIFVADGFDPGDSRGVLSVYNSLNYIDSIGDTSNLGDYVRENAGFDVVIVNFPTYVNSKGDTIDGGADYVERNALSMVSVIEKVNSMKVGNEKNVVIGPSMAGLITRYALCYMETKSIDHETRLWISFDSPHNGANVAMSIQYLINYLGYGYPDLDAMKGAVNGMLRSKAAMQMLVDHIDAHGSSQPLTPHGVAQYRVPFQHRLDSIGFPQLTRNISITNGSGKGSIFKDLDNTPVYPGYTVLEGEIPGGDVLGLNTRLKVKGRFMPKAGQTIEVVHAEAQVQTVFWATVDTYTADAQSSSTSDGIDTAPGGLFDLLGLLKDFTISPEYEQLIKDAVKVFNAGAFNFIPTTSAMALYNEPDYYHQFALGQGDTPWDDTLITNSATPFVNWHLADTNESHVQLTEENVEFALCEIIEPTYELVPTSPTFISTCEGQSFNVVIDFKVKSGCFQIAHFTVQGVPAGGEAILNFNELTSDDVLTLHCEDFPVGNYTLHVVPDSNMNLALPIVVKINENIPDLRGKTEFSTDGGINFAMGDTAIVYSNSNLNLRIPTNLFNGSAEWFSPKGVSHGSAPILTHIIDEGDLEGTWTIDLLFNSTCNVYSNPSTIYFELIVDDELASLSSEDLNQLFIYPNPADGFLTIENTPVDEVFIIQLIDTKGSVVYQKNHSTSNGKIMIDVQPLSSGTYSLLLESKRRIEERKLIIDNN